MKNVLILIELKMFFIIEFYKLLIQKRFNIKEINIIYKKSYIKMIQYKNSK